MKKLFILILLLFASPAIARDVSTIQDFDDGSYSPWSANWCYFSYTCDVIDSPLGKPGKSFNLTHKNENCGIRETKGGELKVNPELDQDCVDDCHVWHGMKLYFNKHTAVPGNDFQLLQFHGDPEPYVSPQYAMYYESGTNNLTLTTRNCADATMTYNGCDAQYAPDGYETITHAGVAPVVLDSWMDVVVEIKTAIFAADGFVKVWVNGVLEYDNQDVRIGFNRPENGYWKVGIYCFSCDCNESEFKQVIYDDITFCASPDGDPAPCRYSDVAPPGSPIPAGES